MMPSCVPSSQCGLRREREGPLVADLAQHAVLGRPCRSAPTGRAGWAAAASASSAPPRPRSRSAASRSIRSLRARLAALACSRGSPGAARPISLESRFCSACRVCESFLRSRTRASGPSRRRGRPGCRGGGSPSDLVGFLAEQAYVDHGAQSTTSRRWRQQLRWRGSTFPLYESCLACLSCRRHRITETPDLFSPTSRSSAAARASTS